MSSGFPAAVTLSTSLTGRPANSSARRSSPASISASNSGALAGELYGASRRTAPGCSAPTTPDTLRARRNHASNGSAAEPAAQVPAGEPEALAAERRRALEETDPWWCHPGQSLGGAASRSPSPGGWSPAAGSAGPRCRSRRCSRVSSWAAGSSRSGPAGWAWRSTSGTCWRQIGRGRPRAGGGEGGRRCSVGGSAGASAGRGGCGRSQRYRERSRP